jgi:Winged helix DNA-binding domain
LDLSLTGDQAVIELVTASFDRYGPATLRDATWWSGLTATDITTALLACGRPLVAVATPWSEDPCLMFADLSGESANSEVTTRVQFLAHEDTALKAYSQTRSRYLGGLPQRRAFNQTGEALPTVIRTPSGHAERRPPAGVRASARLATSTVHQAEASASLPP